MAMLLPPGRGAGIGAQFRSPYRVSGEGDEMGGDTNWSGWPACPQCGRSRQAICPTCGYAGNQFPLAEYQAMAEPQRSTRDSDQEGAVSGLAKDVLLMCTRCDEAFHPRFYRICPACGYAAEEGIEPEKEARLQIPSRVLLAIYALVAFGGLLLLYFWSLFRDH